jgi:hypothetical protein
MLSATVVELSESALKHILQIEMVQRRAARFIKSNYSRDPGTVTTFLEQLELQPLSTRRKIAE